jgi:hypothetical protein
MPTSPPLVWTRRAVTAVATAIAWFCLALVPAAPAQADPVGAVLRDDVGCENGGIVRAYPPINVTSSAREDIAYWAPTLAVWNGSDWEEYRKPNKAPAYAYILPGGINKGYNGGWRSSTTHGQLLNLPFGDLPAGEYAVYHEVKLQEADALLTGWSSQTCSLS